MTLAQHFATNATNPLPAEAPDTPIADMTEQELMAMAVHDDNHWERRRAIFMLIHRARLDEIRKSCAAMAEGMRT